MEETDMDILKYVDQKPNMLPGDPKDPENHPQTRPVWDCQSGLPSKRPTRVVLGGGLSGAAVRPASPRQVVSGHWLVGGKPSDPGGPSDVRSC